MLTVQILLGVDTTGQVGLDVYFWLRAGVGALVLFGLIGVLDCFLRRATLPSRTGDGRDHHA